MEDYLHRLYLTTKQMLSLLENISNNSNELVGKTSAKVYFKDDVIKALRISDKTYSRYVATGKLVPKHIGNIHIYQEEDLGPIIAELKRRGRL